MAMALPVFGMVFSSVTVLPDRLVLMATGQSVAHMPSTAQVSRPSYGVIFQNAFISSCITGLLQSRQRTAQDNALAGCKGKIAARTLMLAIAALNALVNLFFHYGQWASGSLNDTYDPALMITPGFRMFSGSIRAFNSFIMVYPSVPHSCST